MQQIKPTKISYLPTELNYFMILIQRFKNLRQQIVISRLLILGLIIWNIGLTLALIPTSANIPQFTHEETKQILQLEEIPIEFMEVNNALSKN